MPVACIDVPPGISGRAEAAAQERRPSSIPQLTSTAYFTVVTGTLGIAAASWVVSVRRMHGMDRGGCDWSRLAHVLHGHLGVLWPRGRPINPSNVRNRDHSRGSDVSGSHASVPMI